MSRHRGDSEQKHRMLSIFGYGILTVTLVLGLFSVYTYRHLNENLSILDLDNQIGADRPEDLEEDEDNQALNVLVMGSDTRDGEGNNIDGLSEGGQRSDTTLLFHLSADREFAYGVSLPRDAMVQRPTCYDEDMEEIPGGHDMWNAAFSYGGPACTIRQFEQLTGVRVNHYVVVDFNGFKDMVDAIDGVEVCIPEEVDDEVGNIHLEEGTRTVEGQEALDYVRVRHGLSDNGDIGRMKRQQAFVAAMANKVMSKGVIARPDRLLGFLNAATRSLSLDPDLDSVKKVADLAREFQDIGLDRIKFITVPWDFYEPDPNRLVWDEKAEKLWHKVEHDKRLGKALTSEVITAARNPGSSDSEGSSEEESAEEPSEDADEQGKKAERRADAAETAATNGLCS